MTTIKIAKTLLFMSEALLKALYKIVFGIVYAGIPIHITLKFLDTLDYLTFISLLAYIGILKMYIKYKK